MKKITIITLLLFTTMIGYAQKESGASYIIDNIKYKTDSPTTIDIELWIKDYTVMCSKKIKRLKKGYKIPKDMIEFNPCLVYLILTSESLEDEKEQQSWFDLYPLMNEEQIMQLYNILYREKYEIGQLTNNKTS